LNAPARIASSEGRPRDAGRQARALGAARSPGGNCGRVPAVGAARPTSATGAEVTDRPSQQRREQMLNLAARQRDQPERCLLASVFGNGDHQEGVGEQGQGGPAVAGAPAAHLV
jgi:hypothetical protein